MSLTIDIWQLHAAIKSNVSKTMYMVQFSSVSESVNWICATMPSVLIAYLVCSNDLVKMFWFLLNAFLNHDEFLPPVETRVVYVYTHFTIHRNCTWKSTDGLIEIVENVHLFEKREKRILPSRNRPAVSKKISQGLVCLKETIHGSSYSIFHVLKFLRALFLIFRFQFDKTECYLIVPFG